MTYKANAQTIWPQLAVSNFQKAVEWYDKVFGATVVEIYREDSDDGKGRVMHSLIQLGNGNGIFLIDACPKTACKSAEEGEANSSALHMQISDLDACWAAMKEAGGANILMELEVQFWGDKYGRFADPYGHVWSVGEMGSIVHDPKP